MGDSTPVCPHCGNDTRFHETVRDERFAAYRNDEVDISTVAGDGPEIVSRTCADCTGSVPVPLESDGEAVADLADVEPGDELRWEDQIVRQRPSTAIGWYTDGTGTSWLTLRGPADGEVKMRQENNDDHQRIALSTGTTVKNLTKTGETDIGPSEYGMCGMDADAPEDYEE